MFSRAKQVFQQGENHSMPIQFVEIQQALKNIKILQKVSKGLGMRWKLLVTQSKCDKLFENQGNSMGYAVDFT